jgi:23S rRNA U2552 (ribose-2'-O)-methylase RlmE/FtsJ
LCEAPGGFIECISDIRRKKNLRTDFISISKKSEIIYDRFLEESKLFYGDITDPKIIDETIINVFERFPDGIDLITADGGFDIKNFNGQEVISSKLLLCEIYIALSTQKLEGMFVIKFFDMFTHNVIIYYLLLCSCYSHVKIIKPKSSRNCNSERYLVCYGYRGLDTKIMVNLQSIIKKYVNHDGVYTIIYPNFDFGILPSFFTEKIKNFNNVMINYQIETINESIKMISNKDTYFQSLLLKIFLDKFNKYANIIHYKNILFSRIQKCISFLKFYNINCHQIVYRISEN